MTKQSVDDLIAKMKADLEAANLEPNVPEIEPKPCECEFGESLRPEQIERCCCTDIEPTIAEQAFKRMLVQFLYADKDVKQQIRDILLSSLDHDLFEQKVLMFFRDVIEERLKDIAYANDY